MWPWFKSQLQRHMWVELVAGLPCSERFFPGTPVFPTLLQNQLYSNCTNDTNNIDSAKGSMAQLFWRSWRKWWKMHTFCEEEMTELLLKIVFINRFDATLQKLWLALSTGQKLDIGFIWIVLLATRHLQHSYKKLITKILLRFIRYPIFDLDSADHNFCSVASYFFY